LIAPAEDRTISATEEAALDTLEEPEKSPNEESTEAAPAHIKQASRLRVALPDVNDADTGGKTSNLYTALAEGSDQVTGELRSTKARKAPQPEPNDQGRTASTRSDHTRSLQAGLGSTESYAQHECGELRRKLSATQHENSRLNEKVKLMKEDKLELIDPTNTVREQKDSLEATLFEKEEEYKQLLKIFELAKSEVKQYLVWDQSGEPGV
jgi:chromosome segregation ATPase